jgi:PiT family inorganic phosphate transporter
MWTLFSGAFLGWGLGANDSANVFGTAVSSRMISYRLAITLIAFFAILGAWSIGAVGIETLQSITTLSQKSAVQVTLAAAICVTFFTKLSVPISTSQALGGAIFTLAAMEGHIETSIFLKIISAWIATPIGAAIISFFCYHFFTIVLQHLQLDIYKPERFLRYGLVLCGCYGAFSLGANNVANSAMVLAMNEHIGLQLAVFLGGIFIAIGAITYSKKVMLVVGKGVVKLDAFSAFIVVLSHSLTLHFFAELGVPVSSSQAIIGSIVGISMVKGLYLINFKVLFEIVLAWILTPFVGGGTFWFISHLT